MYYNSMHYYKLLIIQIPRLKGRRRMDMEKNNMWLKATVVGKEVLKKVIDEKKSTYSIFFMSNDIAGFSIQNVQDIAQVTETDQTMVLNVIHEILISLKKIDDMVISHKDLMSIINNLETDNTEDTYDTLVAEMVKLGITSI